MDAVPNADEMQGAERDPARGQSASYTETVPVPRDSTGTVFAGTDVQSGAFPLLNAGLCGTDEEYNILVMERLGASLEDIKAENFLIGWKSRRRVLYAIDLGLARPWRADSGAHVPYKGERWRLPKLPNIFKAEESGCFDDRVAIQRRRLAWKHRPERIVLLRHGQSEGAVAEAKGDSRLELTREGICQAKEADIYEAYITNLFKHMALRPVSIVFDRWSTSPFERAMQTLLGLYEGGFPRDRVRIHIDPQIREQESFRSRWGEEKSNLRRFWDKLFGENGNGLLAGDMCLVVTHGLTIRLMLMYEFCTEESFPARLPWATRKDPDEHEGHEEFDADAKAGQLHHSFAICWKKINAWLVLYQDDAMLDRFDKFLDAQQNKILRARSLPFTVINYLEIPQPRTMHIEAVLSRLVPGHNHSDSGTAKLEELAAKGPALTEEQVEFIDWWGSRLSYEGKMLYLRRGRLPWQGLGTATEEAKYERILDAKMSITPAELCKGEPAQFASFLKYARSLGYAEEPDYAKLRGLFRSVLLQQKGVKESNIADLAFEWEADQAGSADEERRLISHGQVCGDFGKARSFAASMLEKD
ncbi:Casein kinase I [Symbiodinium microadriaticum]|uniref:Casein kinase I n=1 Tax=Symbiodinium microadriaticum TaxID=2951 RepID=A0A1Q9D2R4_SYMMI|nr:Casein kinase I [Symbiodinium microadriaticum]